MRINGVLYSPVIPKRGNDPFDVTFTRHKIRGTDLFTDFNITVTIVASVKYNETVLECQDETSPRSTATLIIKGITMSLSVNITYYSNIFIDCVQVVQQSLM